MSSTIKSHKVFSPDNRLFSWLTGLLHHSGIQSHPDEPVYGAQLDRPIGGSRPPSP